MKIKKPSHAKSTDRTIPSPINYICGDPYSWFDTEFFRNEGLFVTSFDFFVNWSNNTFQPYAWIKRILYADFTINANDIHDAIINCDGNDNYQQAKLFCEHNSIDLSYIIIPNIRESEWNNLNNKVVLFNVNKYETNNNDNSAVECLNILELIDRIHSYKVNYSSAFMGSKGLYWSTSSLESFLSKPQNSIGYSGDAIYPGDADIILFDHEYKPLVLVEIKKHTKAYEEAPSIKDDSISLWYRKDRNKYQSLDILQKHWHCEFYMLIYPTTGERILKLERVDNLSVISPYKLLPIPDIHSQIKLQSFQTQFFDFMNSKPVWANTTASGIKIYHTKSDCIYIPQDNQRVRRFESISQAEEHGFRLCQNCRH